MPGPGGKTLGSNYVYVTAEKPGSVVRVNTVDVNSAGQMTEREATAAQSINTKTGGQIITIPKGKGLGDLPDKVP